MSPRVEETLALYERLVARTHPPGRAVALARRINARIALMTPRELDAYYRGVREIRKQHHVNDHRN